MKVALVNTNRMKPPIAPIGLEYSTEALNNAGFSPEILDLCFEEDSNHAIRRFFSNNSFDIIGLTFPADHYVELTFCSYL